jgi:hypothetical protein
MAALLHDFAKMDPGIRKSKTDERGQPITFDRSGKPTEHFRYVGHDKASADFANKVMTNMAFEPSEKKFVKTIVDNHMLANNLANSKKPKSIGYFLNRVQGLYKQVIQHSLADQLSKGNLKNEERDQINRNNIEQLQRVEDYKNEMKENVYKPLLNGNEIENIVRQYAPLFLQKKIFIKDQGKNLHYIKYITEKLLEQQWNKNVMNKNNAQTWVVNLIKNMYRLWQKTNPIV